ncbi:phage exclusion protein Lit family protein [Hoylesella nanceiensis]
MCNIKSEKILPIEALTNNFIELVKNTPKLFETIKDEWLTNEFSNTITFVRTEGKDWEVAEIAKGKNGLYCVSMHINFAQYMWSVGLYLLVYFDNTVQIPMMDKANSNAHGYKCDEALCRMAIENYKRARQFMYDFDINLPRTTPNILDPTPYEDMIGRANSIYLGAMTFIYAHEVFHNYLGHTKTYSNSEQSKKDELAADELAIDALLTGIPEFKNTEYKLGIIVMMFAILFLRKDYLSGGESHPDMDIRIKKAIAQLKIPTEDNLWGFVSFGINVFLQAYKLISSEEVASSEFETYKDMYDFYIIRLEDARKKMFPKEVKRDWE